MTNERIMRELRALHDRIYRLEAQLKAIEINNYSNTTSKIDYLSMMTDVELEIEEEEEEEIIEEGVEENVGV